MLSETLNPVASLYVHVPFCARKCDYCAFYSKPFDALGDAALVSQYLRAVEAELSRVAARLKPRTLFFGGGTPSLLSVKQWQQLSRALDRLSLLGAEECTIECNPATITADKAKVWQDLGINRVSLGIQSLHDPLLERLGRIHSRRQALDSYALLRKSGFENISLDLMFAIPGQTLEQWHATVSEILALGSEHLSCYEIIYEEDTPLFERLQAGQVSEDEDLACVMYEHLLEATAAHGFHQYEVANFARDREPRAGFFPSLACRHNVNYWRGGDYYGAGPSAVSYVRGVRSQNWGDVVKYCAAIERNEPLAEWREELPPPQSAGELAAFGLRMNAGWRFDEFQRVTGYDLREQWRGEMDALVARGWGEITSAGFRLTALGMRFADAAATEFLR